MRTLNRALLAWAQDEPDLPLSAVMFSDKTPELPRKFIAVWGKRHNVPIYYGRASKIKVRCISFVSSIDELLSTLQIGDNYTPYPKRYRPIPLTKLRF